MPNIPNFTQGNRVICTSARKSEVRSQESALYGDRLKQGMQPYKVGVDLAKETLYARSPIETPGVKYLIGE